MLEVLSNLNTQLRYNKFIQKYSDTIQFFESFGKKSNPISFNFCMLPNSNSEDILNALNDLFDTPENNVLYKEHSYEFLNYALSINIDYIDDCNKSSIKNMACGAIVYAKNYELTEDLENYIVKLKKLFSFIIIFSDENIIENFQHHKDDNTYILPVKEGQKKFFSQLEKLLKNEEALHKFCKKTEETYKDHSKILLKFIKSDLSSELKNIELKLKILETKKRRELGSINRSQNDQEIKIFLKTKIDELSTTLNLIGERISEKLDTTYGTTFNELKEQCDSVSLKEDFFITDDKENVYLHYNETKQQQINNLINTSTAEVVESVNTYYEDSLNKLESDLNLKLEQSKVPTRLNTEVLKEQLNDAANSITISKIAVEQKSEYDKGTGKMDYFSAFRKWMFLPISLGMLITYISKPGQAISQWSKETKQINTLVSFKAHEDDWNKIQDSCYKLNFAQYKLQYGKEPGFKKQSDLKKDCAIKAYRAIDVKTNGEFDFTAQFTKATYENSFVRFFKRFDMYAYLGIVMIILLPWFYKQGKKEVLSKAEKTKTDTEKRTKEDLKNKLLTEGRATMQKINNNFRSLQSQLKQNFQNEINLFNKELESYFSNQNVSKGAFKMETEALYKSLQKDLQEYSSIQNTLTKPSQSRSNFRTTNKISSTTDIKDSIFKRKEETIKAREKWEKKREALKKENEKTKQRLEELRKIRANRNSKEKE